MVKPPLGPTGRSSIHAKNIVAGSNDAAMIRARIEDLIKAEVNLACGGGAFDGLRHEPSCEVKVSLNSRAAN